jgi:hypothetical protein
MSCPFFKEDYNNIGFCSTSDFPYIPSIREMEQQCFKDGSDSCAKFNDLSATEHNRRI